MSGSSRPLTSRPRLPLPDASKARKRVAHMLKHQCGIHVHPDYILTGLYDYHSRMEPALWRASGTKQGRQVTIYGLTPLSTLAKRKVFEDVYEACHGLYLAR